MTPETTVKRWQDRLAEINPHQIDHQEVMSQCVDAEITELRAQVAQYKEDAELWRNRQKPKVAKPAPVRPRPDGPGDGWRFLNDGERLQDGDGYWLPERSMWVDYVCRPDLFRGEREFVHSGWAWRRKDAAIDKARKS